MQVRGYSHPANGSGRLPGRRVHSEEIARMQEVPLFAQLPPQLLKSILADAVVERYAPGDTLFRQDELPHFLHIVMQGEIGLFAVGNGHETVVEILKKGDVFITAAVLMNRPYLMSARTLLPSRVLLLPAERLRLDALSVPGLAQAILDSLSTQFRVLVRELKILKLKSTPQRLALYLLSRTVKRGGTTVLWLPYTKSHIAARIGIRPETLSRVFSALRQYGVRVEGARVVIGDVSALAEFCNQRRDRVPAGGVGAPAGG